VALFASALTGLPFSFTAHAKDIYTSDSGQLRRKLEKARFAVTCTAYNARRLRALSGGNTPIHTIYHGIDLNFFTFGTEPPESPPPHRLLTIGRLVPKKGYDDLLLALKLLDRAGLDFEWTQIGSGELEPRVRRMVSELGLERRVRMVGTLPRREVLDHFRRAHCFVLACKVAADGDRDGIPNVLVEAMATGVPVVATKVSAIPELVGDGATGVLAPPEDPVALARAILGVLLHPGKSRERARAARAKVEKDFDDSRNVLRLERLFKAALEGGRHEDRSLLPQ
jgi:glycosyltransferase involved in cell wall biosynthesis